MGVFHITHRTLLVRPLYKSFASLLSTCLLVVAAALLGELLGARATVVPLLACLSAVRQARTAAGWRPAPALSRAAPAFVPRATRLAACFSRRRTAR